MCLTCSIINKEIIPVGGIIYKDNYVILHHCIDESIAGYLIVSPVRHVLEYNELNDLEIQSLSNISKLAIKFLKEINGIDKVYFANFGEETSHFHIHLFPRYKWMLNYSEEEIYTCGKVDGAKLFSFCRKEHKVERDKMEKDDILVVIEYLRRSFCYA